MFLVISRVRARCRPSRLLLMLSESFYDLLFNFSIISPFFNTYPYTFHQQQHIYQHFNLQNIQHVHQQEIQQNNNITNKTCYNKLISPTRHATTNNNQHWAKRYNNKYTNILSYKRNNKYTNKFTNNATTNNHLINRHVHQPEIQQQIHQHFHQQE